MPPSVYSRSHEQNENEQVDTVEQVLIIDESREANDLLHKFEVEESSMAFSDFEESVSSLFIRVDESMI